jgi:hypothetical protein
MFTAGRYASDRAKRCQRFHRRLARGSAPARQLVLRDRELDGDSLRSLAPEAFAQLHQPPCDTPERVQRGELEAPSVGLAQPGGQDPDHFVCRIDVLKRARHHRRGRDNSVHLLERQRRRGTRLAIEHRQLAEYVARTAQAKHCLLPARSAAADQHPAAFDQEHALGSVPLNEQRLATLERPTVPVAAERGGERVADCVLCRHAYSFADGGCGA